MQSYVSEEVNFFTKRKELRSQQSNQRSQKISRLLNPKTNLNQQNAYTT